MSETPQEGETVSTAVTDSTDSQNYGTPGAIVGTKAEWGTRAIAWLIDWGIAVGIYVVGFILAAIAGAIADALGLLMFFVTYAAAIAYFVWNLCIKQGSTGQSIGKKMLGIKLVRDETDQPVGGGMAFVRYLLAGVLSTLTFGIYGLLDYLWPLWDPEKTRLTDKMVKMSVVLATSSRAEEVRRLERLDRWKRRLPILPALIFTIVVTQIPFLFTLFYSLTDWRIDKPEPRQFIGLENYGSLPDDKFFLDAAWVSVQMTVMAVLFSLVVGTGLAILLDRKFFGQGFVRTLLITPFLVMPVVAGFLWKSQMFNATFGVINWVIELFGGESIEFATRYPLGSIVVVLVWQWSPFMMLIVLAGLQGQDTSVLEAARVDGATSFGIFRQITLPQLRPFLELGTLLGSIYLIQVYDHIEVITGGAPGSKNLPYYIAQRSIGGGNQFGLASAMAIVVVIAAIIIANIGLRVLSNLLEDQS